MSTHVEGLQIGELAERVEVSTHTLRAWERRYGILKPSRTTGGYRVYSELDVRRVSAVLGLREQGVSIAEAARRVNANVVAQIPAGRRIDAAAIVYEMHRAVDRFDEFALSAALDRLLSSHRLEEALRDGLMPFLVQLGGRWERGEVSVAHEHFATQLIRRRLDSYSLMWADGDGPLVVLACPPGEQHDIPLLVLGVLLARSGWRIRYIGQETPVADLAQACSILQPDLVVMAATRDTTFRRSLDELRDLARSYRLLIGGRGATDTICADLGVEAMSQDVVAAASALIDESGRTGRSDSDAAAQLVG